MKILALSGSYRKGKTIDILIDKAIEGAKAVDGTVEVERISLVDKKIDYCKNCMACRRDDPSKPYARCIINDDMQEIYPLIDAADAYIFGTPVNMANVTAVMKTFLERACWVFSRPGKRGLLNGCPEPRSSRRKKAVIIVTSGLVPPSMRMFCDNATPMLKDFCGYCLNAEVPATLYAGAIEKRGVESYFKKARRLGEWLLV